MYFSQIFHMFFKGLQPCLSCSTPNGNFVNNYCQLLNKDIFNPGNFCIFVFAFWQQRQKLHVHGYVSWKKSYFFYRNYSCTHVGTAAQIYFFLIRALCSHLFTLSANAWTPLSLTLLQLASTDFSHWQRAATCSSIDSPINSLPPHRLKFSSWR